MRVVLFGAGTYGQVYLSYLRDDGAFDVAGFMDDDPRWSGQVIHGVPVLGTTADLPRCHELGIEGIIAPIGNNAARLRILDAATQLGLSTPGYRHPTAIVSKDAVIGNGVYILPGSIVMPFAELGEYVMVSMGVNIAHHTVLHRGVFVSTGVNLGAGVDVGECAYLGIGGVIMTGVKSIGARAVVGAGAVVIRDVPADTTVVGVPAKPIAKTS